MVEIWKKIPRTKGYYSASSLGRLRSNARKVRYVHRTGKEFWRNKKQRILILHLRLDGYITGYLSIDGKQFGHTVHSLIARTFWDDDQKDLMSVITTENDRTIDQKIFDMILDLRITGIKFITVRCLLLVLKQF